MKNSQELEEKIKKYKISKIKFIGEEIDLIDEELNLNISDFISKLNDFLNHYNAKDGKIKIVINHDNNRKEYDSYDYARNPYFYNVDNCELNGKLFLTTEIEKTEKELISECLEMDLLESIKIEQSNKRKKKEAERRKKEKGEKEQKELELYETLKRKFEKTNGL